MPTISMTKDSMTRRTLLILLMIVAGSVMSEAWAQTLPDGVTGYETVTVTIPATSYDADAGGSGLGAPQMARVKYNKKFPLVITSDDMGKTELTNNWAAVNGYPVINDWIDLGIQPGGTKFLQAPYKKYYMQGRSSSVNDYQPMTYTDNVGKTQRYRMTSAIMPFELKSDGTSSYDKIDANDAKLMLRTGWSFAQHDVDDISSVDNISTAMTANNTIWATKVGIGLKVMVEPNGNHNYLDAGRANSGICWNIFQNSTTEYPFQSKALSTWAATRSDWTSTGFGTMPTTFSSKPTGGYARTFFQGNESSWMSTVNSATGDNIVIGGTHGLGDEIKNHLRTATNVTDNAWVGSADEVWEYYHIYNNVVIENVNWSGSALTFDVKVPTYLKNQYRELTLNIPGLTGGGTPTFSTASGKTVPVTGGSQQTSTNGIGYTMNIGLETSINTHISELMTIYRDDQTNLFVKRDLAYLISQLWDGSTYTTQLNATAKHDLTIQSSLGTTLATIKTDTDGDKSFAVPRYIVSSDKLYEVAANSSRPNYAQTITTTTTPSAISYTEKSLSSLQVGDYTPKAVLLVEGEDMTGVTILGADLDLPQSSSGRYWAMALGSGGMAGNLVSGTAATVTSALPRGKYKAVIGYGETYKSQGTYNYNLLVDGTQVATVSSSSATNNAVTELTTAEFEVTANGLPITLTTDNTNTGSRWIDYIYFVQTGTLEPQPPTAAIAASAGTTAAIKTGNSITITANATQHGGSNYTGIKIYQCNDDAGTVSGDALATSNTETVSYTFTPSTAGTYYFKAVANDATLNDGTSEVITVTVVDNIDTYTLSIIDKSGNVALSTTVAGASLTTDPLPDAYRSPFAQNYKYYNTIAEAQANSGSNLTSTSDWIQSTVYVGYDVDATKMAAGKVHAIWANGRYMHVIQNAGNSHNTQKSWHNAYSVQNQQYDVEGTNATRIGYSTGPYVQHNNISPTTLPFLDNSYMWELGTDPYNIKLKNKAYGFYQSSNAYNNQTLYDVDEEASAETYCLLYWADKNGGNVDTSADYYRLMYKTDLTDDGVANKRTMYQWSNYWRINNDNDWNTKGELYIKELPAINLNVLDGKKNIECTLQYYLKSDATMPSDGTDNGTSYYTPFNLYRSYTSKHKWWYDAATTDAVSSGSAPDATKIENNGGNIYVTYTLDEVWGSGTFSDTKQPFHLYPSNGGTVYWYSVRLNPADSRYSWFLKANSDINQPLQNCNGTNLATSDYDSSHKEYYWAFKGTPYNLKIINMHHGDGYYLGVSKTATDIDAQTYLLPDTEDNNVTWEMTDGLSQNNMYPFFRLRASYNGENTSSANPLYISYNSSTPNNANLAKVAGGNQSIGLTEKTTTDITKVSLTADAAPYYVDEAITLTATATPSPLGTDRVTKLVIEQETSTDVWEEVGTAYTGSDVAGVAEKDATTKAVTVTYEFTPAAEGTFNFRAHAVVDGADQYSTDTEGQGGDGDVVEIIATVKPLEPYNSTYTLTLIDKDGDELLTETSVPASRITATNSISNRNGDPLNDDWRSPLVTTYKYYEGTPAGKSSAQAADDDNIVDWNTYTGTTIYVGYTVSDAIDLNGKDSNGNYKFSSLNDDTNSLMQNRVHRDNNDANPWVRNASKFGKMYMLKFKTSAAYNLEDGSDNRNATATPANTLIYPYTNGDGPIYMYSHQRYLDQKDNGASTRTRWPWFLVSPKNDPYHVYITSWQSSHTDNTDNTNHYSYLRTYYNSTINQVVTNNVTDDDRTLEGGNGSQIMPTDYMILSGSGTDGLNYKLMTSSPITDASTTERRTVTSFEQYWRNNPTAQVASGGTKNSTVVAIDNSTLTGYGWHNYKTWVNAANWAGTKYTINGKEYSKDYLYDDHWYMTVNVGDGSLDIVEANIDGVLVLVDNHGWEVMRHPIVEHDDDDYATVQEALRKYDSPMVKNYKFYSTRNVDHKVPGYHKYDITYLTSDKTKITGLTLINSSETITSLANYPEVTSGGALTDLYVTYEVADDYANSYTGAATEEATSASSFLLKQGSNYAKADGTSITSTSDASTADRWKLKPNFNIDAEMGYLYTNGTDSEKDKTTLEALYNTNSSNGFDPYNLQIQNVTTSTYFTTNASTAALNSGAWTGNGSSLSLAAVSTQITPTGYDNKTLAVTNATFMAVQDSYGNMRLMPRFQHEQVVDNFSTLADPATLTAYDATSTQTTQLSTPVTYHIIDNSGNDALQMTVTEGIGLNVPDALKSPMVSAYQFHSTQAHAASAETRGTGNLTVAQENVYVSYTVDAEKMASTKKYAIIANNSGIYMHANLRVNQTHTTDSRFWIQNQQWDVSNGNGTRLNATNLPFIDDNYLWQLGDDPYNIQIKNLKTGRYSEPVSTGSQGNLNTTATASYCLLYWNAETTGENYTLRYREATPSVTPQYVIYSTNNDGDWRLSTTATEANAKLTLLYDATLPDLNINVQQTGSNNVEATLKMHYVSTAKMSDFSAKLPYFLRRAYTKDQFDFYYDAAGKHAIAANATFDGTYFDGSNIYLRYTTVDDWNTDNLFRVSTAEQKNWYALLYYHSTEASQQYLYLNTSNNQVRGKTKSSSSASDENFNWALVGSPYALKLINRAATDKVIGLPESTTANTYAQPYTEGTEGIVTDWEMVVIANSNSNSYPSIRPQGSLSQSDRPNFYLAANGDDNSLPTQFASNTCLIKAYEKSLVITYHIKDNASGQVVEFTVGTVVGSSIATLPTSLQRLGTKNVTLHTTSYDGDVIAADATATADLTDIYVTYDINYTDGTASEGNALGVANMFSTAESPKWFTIKNGTQQIYYGGSNLTSVQNNRNSETEADMWAFIGTPYHFEIINRAAGTTLHAATSSTESGSHVYVTDDAATYPNYIWETVISNASPWISFRLQGTIYGLTGAQGFNSSRAAILKKNNSTYIDALTITPVAELTFHIYGPDNTLSASYDIPITTYNNQEFSADGTSDLSKLLRRHYTRITAISANADFSSPMDSYTVTNESVGQTIYVKWDYNDEAPVFSTGSDLKEWQYYIFSSSNLYEVTVTDDGNGGTTKTFTADASVSDVRAHTHQFALVGNPYAFKFYSRSAEEYIGLDGSGNPVTVAEAEALEWDLPYYIDLSLNQFRMRRKGTTQFLNGLTVSTPSSTPSVITIQDIVVPIRVFKDGATSWTDDSDNDQVDYREYAFTYPSVNNTNILISDLAATHSIGNAHDYRHAFCDYDYYRSYDWSSELSNPVGSEGLPYVAGTNQWKRQFFATYTVDEENFSKLYLISPGNTTYYACFGRNNALTDDGTTYDLKFYHSGGLTFAQTIDNVRADDTGAYRWVMTGDPYNLQLTCIGMGDNYESYPLSATVLHTSSDAANATTGDQLLLTNDDTYGILSHFEIIARSDGQYVFFLKEDGTDRYTHNITGSGLYTQPILCISELGSSPTEYILTPAIPQFSVTWHVVENGSTVASKGLANVSQGTQFTIEDMPDVLRRHFCTYSNMYSDLACTTQFTDNTATLGSEALSIYVPYKLADGAPTFYASVAAYNSTATESQDPCLIRLYQNKYVRDNSGDADIVTTKDDASANSVGKWVLIGTPYQVQFYNVARSEYLYADMSNIQSGNSILVGAADGANDNKTWTLLDDKTGLRSAVCLYEADNSQRVYMGYSGSDVVMNILSSRTLATGAEFIGSHGIDGVQLVLHYGAQTLRKDGSGTSMARQTETFPIDSYFGEGTLLESIMPEYIKRAFCDYTFSYNSSDETAVTRPMCTASDGGTTVAIDIRYTVDSPFLWSTADATWENKHWYYLVNNHIQGTESGKMVYRDSGPKLRVSTGLVDTHEYLYNFEWCVIGDPYGFKMLNHYDPDQLFSQYVSVTSGKDTAKEGLQIEQQSNNDNHLYEMMPGHYSYNFWMHPVYSSDLLGEYSSDSYSYVGHNYNGSAAIIPDIKRGITYLHSNAAANLRLEIRTNTTLKEYLDYAGFVGSIKTSVVPEGLDDKIADDTATDEDLKALHNLIDNPNNLVQMTQGYYRIIPYVYEKGKIDGEQAHRRYVRGYHYGPGTQGYTDEETTTTNYGYYDRFEYESGNANNKRLMANELPALAEYDPASIFHFEATTEDGHPRYLVTTQGLNLSGHSLSTADAFKTRYEDIGAVTCQLKTVTGDPTNAANHLYLSWQQNSTNNEPNDYRRMALRNCFEMYGFTRLYLQPVGEESDNLMPLKLEMYPGKHTPEGSDTALDYYFASIYVPYDLVLPEGDVYAYAGVKTKNDGKGTENDWRLQCEKLSAQTIGGVSYEKGKFIPAGTPALIRATTTEGTLANTDGHVNDYDYDHANTASGFITLTIPNNAPAGITPEKSFFKGQYLEQILTETPPSGESVYIFGQATNDDYETIPEDKNRKLTDSSHPKLEAGFYINKNTPNGSTDIAKNNLYVRHNKIYLFEKSLEVDYVAHEAATAPSRQFIALDFGETGIDDAEERRAASTGVYDLQGRRVATAEQAEDGSWRRGAKVGVYVVNGRKVVVR